MLILQLQVSYTGKFLTLPNLQNTEKQICSHENPALQVFSSITSCGIMTIIIIIFWKMKPGLSCVTKKTKIQSLSPAPSKEEVKTTLRDPLAFEFPQKKKEASKKDNLLCCLRDSFHFQNKSRRN